VKYILGIATERSRREGARGEICSRRLRYGAKSKAHSRLHLALDLYGWIHIKRTAICLRPTRRAARNDMAMI
jgi:hypothetical protein